MIADVRTGEVLAIKAISGPEHLRELSEQAAIKARFSYAFINGGGPAYAKGTLTYEFGDRHNSNPPAVTSLGSLNTIAEISPLPKIPKTIRVRGLNAIKVGVTLDMKTGLILEAEIVSGGHRSVNSIVLGAAKSAKFKLPSNESMMDKGTGFITFILGNLSRAHRKSLGRHPFLIFPKGALYSTAKTIQKPEPVQDGKKFLAGRVEVAVLVNVYEGTVMDAKGISGPPALLAVSEKAALKATFSPLNKSGSNIKFASGLLVFTYHEDGRVE